MHLIMGASLPLTSFFFLIAAIGLALSFEFVNGFHDTANAVATVIYTHSLPAWIAVIWSGCWNLIGVLTSTGAVAFGILALLPMDLVLNVGSTAGFAMIFALLISAIMWNLGTWYLGLPASSSHTLIGSILGVGLGYSLLAKGHSIGQGVNWAKAGETFEWLIISPVIGFLCAGLLLLLAKALIKKPALFKAPSKKTPPPLWIRGILVLTCTGVSFAHGSNDGQKGMGLILLILIGIVPGAFALNMNTSSKALHDLNKSAMVVDAKLHNKAGAASANVDQSETALSNYLKNGGAVTPQTYAQLAALNQSIVARLDGKSSFSEIPEANRMELRKSIYVFCETINKLTKNKTLTKDADGAILSYKTDMEKTTKWVPIWVQIAIAVALGFGTMIGWKRIVKTVGEKIGKDHLTYGQGAAAELVAMITIVAATYSGAPVSTTHVLSSGVAGTMAANRSGLQMLTLRNIMLAWVLTLPVCVILGATMFSGALYVLLHSPWAFVVAVLALMGAGYIAWRVRLRSHIEKLSPMYEEAELETAMAD